MHYIIPTLFVNNVWYKFDKNAIAIPIKNFKHFLLNLLQITVTKHLFFKLHVHVNFYLKKNHRKYNCVYLLQLYVKTPSFPLPLLLM